MDISYLDSQVFEIIKHLPKSKFDKFGTVISMADVNGALKNSLNRDMIEAFMIKFHKKGLIDLYYQNNDVNDVLIAIKIK